MYTAPTLRSVCSPSSCKPAMSGVEGNAPRLSLGVQKGVFSSEREYPLCPVQRQRRCNLPLPPRKRDKKGYPLRKENTPFAPCSASGAATSPSPLERGIKKEHPLRKENTPFDKAAPIQTSILTPCVSMVMMHPAMVTPSRMTGTARFRRISSTAAMSAPVHAPVPGSGMATKSSSPHVW